MNHQYEECSFEEATHARLAGGKVVNIERLEDTGNFYLDYIPIYRFPLNAEDLQDLGVTPLKKVKVKPIEFEVHPVLVSFSGADIQALILPKDYQHVDFLTRFKCVQILEDEE